MSNIRLTERQRRAALVADYTRRLIHITATDYARDHNVPYQVAIAILARERPKLFAGYRSAW